MLHGAHFLLLPLLPQHVESDTSAVRGCGHPSPARRHYAHLQAARSLAAADPVLDVLEQRPQAADHALLLLGLMISRLHVTYQALQAQHRNEAGDRAVGHAALELHLWVCGALQKRCMHTWPGLCVCTAACASYGAD